MPNNKYTFKTERERFLSHVEMVTESGCWIWNGKLWRNGYGMFFRGHTRAFLAHRVSYQTFVGEIPEGLEIDHLCRVRCCVNPKHLEPVTHKENGRRGIQGNGARASAAKARAKTHCIRGHEFSPQNTKISKLGRRGCKACDREHHRRNSPNPTPSLYKMP